MLCPLKISCTLTSVEGYENKVGLHHIIISFLVDTHPCSEYLVVHSTAPVQINLKFSGSIDRTYLSIGEQMALKTTHMAPMKLR